MNFMTGPGPGVKVGGSTVAANTGAKPVGTWCFRKPSSKLPSMSVMKRVTDPFRPNPIVTVALPTLRLPSETFTRMRPTPPRKGLEVSFGSTSQVGAIHRMDDSL